MQVSLGLKALLIKHLRACSDGAEIAGRCSEPPHSPMDVSDHWFGAMGQD